MAADKKITALTALTNPSSDDLLLVVDDPGGTPISKKITVGQFVANLTHTTASSAMTDALKMTLTANNSHVGNTISAGVFIVQKSGNFTGNTQFAIRAESKLQSSGANVTGIHAAAFFNLDVGESANTGNAYGIVIESGKANNSWTRAVAPQAFIAFGERSSATQPTKYLFDIGLSGTANVSGTAAGTSNANILMAASDTTITRKLSIRVNGTQYFICLTDGR